MIPERAAAPIIRNYLTLTGLYTLAASLIWGVNTLFLLDAGLTLGQVFTVNAIFTGAMALFEIPTGVLADTRGRRYSFLLSIGILLVGTLGYVGASFVDDNFWWFALSSVILGLGYTFYSGAMEAWLVDALNATGFTGELDDVFARGSMMSAIAMLAGSIAGGLLGTLDLSVPFMVRSLLLVLVFIVAAMTMHDIGFTPRPVTLSQLPGEMKTVAQDSVAYGWRNPSIRLLIVASFIQSIFMAWGFYAWQPYFLELLGVNAPWIAGVIAALVALATMGGNSVVEWASRRCGRRTTLMLIAAVIQSLAIVGMGLASSFWMAVGFYLIAMFTTGIYGPVKQAYMHHLTPSAKRATVISFDSLVSSSGSVLGQTGLGRLSGVRSLGAGYVVGGLTTILVWPVLWQLRRRNDDEDAIVGAGGWESACAAQGLPAITSVDSQAGAALMAE